MCIKTQYCHDSVLSNMIYRLNIISMKIPASYFVDIGKLILKFMWRSKRPTVTHKEFKKNNVGELTLLDK